MVRVLKWWEPPRGSVSGTPSHFCDVGTFSPDVGLAFAQQIGQEHGVGSYLLLGPGWWREINVEVAETTYRESGTGAE